MMHYLVCEDMAVATGPLGKRDNGGKEGDIISAWIIIFGWGKDHSLYGSMIC